MQALSQVKETRLCEWGPLDGSNCDGPRGKAGKGPRACPAPSGDPGLLGSAVSEAAEDGAGRDTAERPLRSESRWLQWANVPQVAAYIPRLRGSKNVDFGRFGQFSHRLMKQNSRRSALRRLH